MLTRYIWQKNKKYYYYDTFNTRAEAWKTAQYYKKKNKSRYFILTAEHGFMFPSKKYSLYLDKVIACY